MFNSNRLIKRNSSPADIDSVKVRRKELRVKDKDVALLQRCEAIWMNFEEFREQRARGNRFYDGDQWADIIEVNGKKMTYRQYLMSTGNVVIQTNQIKSRVDTVAGLRVKERTDPICKARDTEEQPYGELVTEGVLANSDVNQMQELEQKWIKDACNGGLAVAYESYDDVTGPNGRLDSWTQYINPNRLLFEADGTDPRHWDLSIIGVVRYGTKAEMCNRFVRKPADYETLKSIYPNQFSTHVVDRIGSMEDDFENKRLVFMDIADPVRCYFCEVWTRESRAMIRLHDTNAGTEEIIYADDYAYRKVIKAENERRKKLALATGWKEADVPYIVGDGYGVDETERNGFFVESYWYCRYLAPDGTILWEGESPYADKSHPFTLMTYSYIDGHIIGYNHDAIDHQLAMNREWVMGEWLRRESAKGHVVVPKSIVPSNVKYEDFAKSWTAIDEILFVELDETKKDLWPKVITGAAQNWDSTREIALIKELMDSSSPVNGALQGKDPGRTVSGTLYHQMSTNASTAVAAFMEQYRNFIKQALVKKMKNIAKFYDSKRWRQIAGRIDSLTDFSTLNLNDVANIEMDLELIESANSLEAREMQEQDLTNLLTAGVITPDEYTQLSKKSYIQKLRQMRQARQSEMEAAQQAGLPVAGVAPETALGAAAPAAPAVPSAPVAVPQ